MENIIVDADLLHINNATNKYFHQQHPIIFSFLEYPRAKFVSLELISFGKVEASILNLDYIINILNSSLKLHCCFPAYYGKLLKIHKLLQIRKLLKSINCYKSVNQFRHDLTYLKLRLGPIFEMLTTDFKWGLQGEASMDHSAKRGS